MRSLGPKPLPTLRASEHALKPNERAESVLYDHCNRGQERENIIYTWKELRR